MLRPVALRLRLVREQGSIVPHRRAVGAPEARQRPARQLLARVPFPLTVLQHAARREALLQPLQQGTCESAFRRPQGCGIPLGTVHVVDRHERRFAAHGETHVVQLQIRIDRAAEGVDGLPLLLGVRLGDARVFMDALHLVGGTRSRRSPLRRGR